MIQTVSLHDFRDRFLRSDTYKNNFSYEGLEALFDYLEQYEDETGEPIEFDMIALCCEYSEYKNAKEACEQYGAETNTPETWLRDRTQVIPFDGGIIIQDF